MTSGRPVNEAVARLWTWLTAHRLRTILAAVVGVLLFGVLGFMVFGQLGPLDALYMSVITISTVGYGDLVTTAAGKLFTIAYIMMSVVVGSTVFAAVAASFVEGTLQSVLGRRSMARKVDELSDHVILCGFGRFGQLTAAELHQAETPFVVIDKDPAQVAQAEAHGDLSLQADATEEDTLVRAGIDRARALLLTLPTDAENVYVILNARELKPKHKDFCIVALARDRTAERKLRMAGATHVVSPYTIGSKHMARQITAPHLAQVMSMATEGEGLEKVGVGMVEFLVDAGSTLVGQSLRDSPVRRDFGVIVVAVVHAGQAQFNPGPDYVVEGGDVLIAVGPRDGLARLREAAHPPLPEPHE
ncbi:MAG: TrkA family potassium uptake protein [Planctomycetota bacterium]